MKLLILTQKIDKNDPVLGFFHQWLQEFSKHYDKVTVICLQKGEYNLPKNISILNLGRKMPQHNIFIKIFYRIKYVLMFYYYILRERNNYDAVFVHMNPEYIVLGGVYWRLMRKKIALWYVHRHVDIKLRVAAIIADIIFTASKESFQLNSHTVQIVGHGIDINKFQLKNHNRKQEDYLRIICVGRITKIKNQELLVEAVNILANTYNITNMHIMFVGLASSIEDKQYETMLKQKIKQYNLQNYIQWVGKVTHDKLPLMYAQNDMAINLSPTGGMDKVVLESLACGVPTIVLNKTFVNVLQDYKDKLMLSKESAHELANKIMDLSHDHISEHKLRELVQKDFSLESLITKIVTNLKI